MPRRCARPSDRAVRSAAAGARRRPWPVWPGPTGSGRRGGGPVRGSQGRTAGWRPGPLSAGDAGDPAHAGMVTGTGRPVRSRGSVRSSASSACAPGGRPTSSARARKTAAGSPRRARRPRARRRGRPAGCAASGPWPACSSGGHSGGSVLVQPVLERGLGGGEQFAPHGEGGVVAPHDLAHHQADEVLHLEHRAEDVVEQVGQARRPDRGPERSGGGGRGRRRTPVPRAPPPAAPAWTGSSGRARPR